MRELTPELRRFLEANIVGVLATRSPSCDVRQSVVYYVLDGDEVLISTVAGRLKAKDVSASGWASLCVIGHERPFPSVTVAGSAEIRTSDIGRPTAAVMQRIMGAEQPPEEQTDDALAEVGRVILAIRITHVGPTSYIEPA